ncbi:M20 family metallopeptidase [Catenulispora yoronensis]|uniref:M20 family metallopeptidase n=2 Tax=Catenulispora yoronensis TaxID=450799 RepID=A0ABP5GTJ7_9ACTN
MSWSGEMLVARLRELVELETPVGSAAHLVVGAEVLAEWGAGVLGRVPEWVVVDGLPHLVWPAVEQRVLLLGHFDTVWPAGTLGEWPFEVAGAVATGPGVVDMKSGIVVMMAAMALVADTSRVGLLLTCDEESGSVGSRALIEREARRSGAVLVGEPANPDGALKVARKGGSAYRLTVHGRAAHAGVEPHLGVNASVEAAHQVLAVKAFADEGAQTTVTPTALTSGTTSNTVPETATLAIDVRAWSTAELARVDGLIRALSARVEGASLSLDGGFSRHPLSVESSRGLFEVARGAAAELGMVLPAGAWAPGASDANFAAAVGAPTLDGLGGVGGGSHSRGEYVDVGQLAPRARLVARMVERLTGEPFGRSSGAEAGLISTL